MNASKVTLTAHTHTRARLWDVWTWLIIRRFLQSQISNQFKKPWWIFQFICEAMLSPHISSKSESVCMIGWFVSSIHWHFIMHLPHFCIIALLYRLSKAWILFDFRYSANRDDIDVNESSLFRHHCSQVTYQDNNNKIIHIGIKNGLEGITKYTTCKCKIQSDNNRAAIHCKRTSHYVKMTDYLEPSNWQLTYNVNTIYYKIG